MSLHRAPHTRSYRRLSPRPGERVFQVVVGESDLWITVRESCGPELEALALEKVREARALVAARLALDPAFGPALVPLPVPHGAPELVRGMYEAAKVMGVGPMATVAGAVAAHVAGALSEFSPDCLVENGGDSMLYSSKERVVGLLPDPAKRAAVGLKLEAGAFPLALCASSGKFGHSLSFGCGDLAVVRAKNACLADAAATAFANMLRSEEDAGRVAELAGQYRERGIDGVFVQCGQGIGIWGDMELVAI